MLLISIPAFGQFVKKYQSPSGFDLDLPGPLPEYEERMDFDGDGTLELVLEHVDDQGNPIDFVVINHEQQVVLWRLDESDLDAIVDAQTDPWGFIGFFPFSPTDDVRVAVFGGRIAGFLQGVDPATNQTLFVFPRSANKSGSADELRYAIFDVDGDSYPDLIVSDPATQTVQVWGVETTSTATEEDIEAALLHLFQSYPNPFRESTTITYEVKQPGPVTVTVYDALGRKVKTLVDAQQVPGSHAVTWDGRDAGGQAVAAGIYFYRLRLGDTVYSKQTIRVK
ncbi:MAG: T9SS type A sorting domain-containing protein [Rhodothermales bacterium]